MTDANIPSPRPRHDDAPTEASSRRCAPTHGEREAAVRPPSTAVPLKLLRHPRVRRRAGTHHHEEDIGRQLRIEPFELLARELERLGARRGASLGVRIPHPPQCEPHKGSARCRRSRRRLEYFGLCSARLEARSAARCVKEL